MDIHKTTRRFLYLPTNASSEKGLTFLELIITICILGLVTSLAVPSFHSTKLSINGKIAADTLISTLNYARLEALSYRKDIVVCPMQENAITCSSDWKLPLSVFTDQNKNQTIDGNDERLKVVEIPGENANIFWRSFGNRPYIRFNLLGATEFQNGRRYGLGSRRFRNIECINHRGQRKETSIHHQTNAPETLK